MDKKGEQKATVIGLMAAIVIGASFYAFNHLICPEKPSKLLDQPGKIFEENIEASLIVHVCGAVKREGVYRMRPGDRIMDALRQAGGAVSYADLSSVNLAENITDGQKIFIPEKIRPADQPGSRAAVGAGQGQVNINRAAADELDSLAGVGPATAKNIIEARPFSKIDDLLKIPRFGKSKLDKIRDRITL